jgi:hypothetical protein
MRSGLPTAERNIMEIEMTDKTGQKATDITLPESSALWSLHYYGKVPLLVILN